MPSARAVAGTTYPILSQCFEFWEEVEAIRRRPSASGRERLAEALRSQRAALANSWQAGELPQLDDAQYVMAATADELFIGLNWDGASDWRLQPLEAELFGTRRAGQEVFARIERLIDGSEPFSAEMAAVYLTALELGFKGTFADADDTQTLATYETELRSMVGREPPSTGPLVSQCYDHTVVAGTGAELPRARDWWIAAWTIAGIFLLAALVVTATRFRGATLEEARQKLDTSFELMTAPR